MTPVLVLLLAASVPSVTGLRCEYAKDPIGIDVARPRLSWRIESARRGERQTAYQVLAASTSEALAADRGDLWDSGRVASDQSVNVEYAGRPLASRETAVWKVRTWTPTEGRPDGAGPRRGRWACCSPPTGGRSGSGSGPRRCRAGRTRRS